ncbi:MAG: hypothetical protein WCS37_09335 [Chloroflexota bacterium]|nr:PHP domain-containing protein [Chloroflexota bacterium]
MCQSHDHEHEEHEHDEHENSCCSPNEDYEKFLADERKRTVSRRTMIKRMTAAGLALASSSIATTNVFASSQARPTHTANVVPFVAEGDDNLFYLSGDHHIHTRYSPDGKYPVQRQVAEANANALDWMVLTDHGGKDHNKLSISQTVPDIIRSRGVFKNLLIFSGLELNIPGGEHGTVMVMPTPNELKQLKEFEANYDGVIAKNDEQTMLAGLFYLNQLDPKPLFFANHPARRGLDSPHEMRNWKLTAPEVVMGFEGAPGHQAEGLLKDADGKYIAYRGGYGRKADVGSYELYPPESYFTYGGFDWLTAKLGGVWDSLLGDGLRWWITANSDSHRYFWDYQDVDATTHPTKGYVTEIDQYFVQPVYGDYAPGEFSRTYVATNDRSYAGVMAGMREGNMFVVTGDLIDRLRFYASGRAPGEQDFGGIGVLTGGTFLVKPGSDVRVQVRLRVPNSPNNNNDQPQVDHVDLIAGQMTLAGYQQGNADLQTNPTTRVVQTYGPGDWRASKSSSGLIIETEYIFRNVQQSFYTRLRGTNSNDRGEIPKMDVDMRGKTGPAPSPWESLWFYSNPIFVVVSDS